MTGYPFTWEHGRNSDGWVESRLDRVFTNVQWRTRFSNFTAEVLGFSTSDHLPILLAVKCFVDQHHAHRFRFENTWLREAGCRTLISDIWQLSPDMDVEGKLVACRTALKSWGTNLRLLHKAEMDESLAIMARLRGAYGAASARKRKNTTVKLLDDSNVWHDKNSGLEEVMSGYFTSLFTSHDCNSEPNASLLAPYSCDEVKSAAFSMKIDKSPGLDGFNPGFFQHYWDIISGDVSRFCIDCLHSGSLPSKLNETALVLIPKKGVPEQMSDLHPIALCNVVYKIMTKMIVNRLKSILPSIVSKSQSAFISGHNIQDNIILAFEAMHRFNMFHRKKKLSGALKMDISKAYDRLEWDFIRDMLIRMGFAQRWVALVFSCSSTVRYWILHNGREIGLILPTRELRQGDPLSPDLFILCAEGLSRLLQEVEEKPDLGNYLGLPSHIGSNKREVFSFVKDRLWKRLNSWKHRALSQAGKERMMTRYWWSKGADQNRGIHWLGWHRMAKHRLDSGTWVTRSLVKAGAYWRIGNSRSVSIWSHPWLKEALDSLVSTPPPPNCTLSVVADLMIGHRWNESLIAQLFNDRDRSCILNIPLSLSSHPDAWCWKFASKGHYFVKSAYRFLVAGFRHREGSEIWSHFWKTKVPPKVLNFCWRALVNVVPCLSLLQSRRVPVDSMCPLCHEAPETVLHILVQCPFARSCWLSSPFGWPAFSAASLRENNVVWKAQQWRGACSDSTSCTNAVSALTVWSPPPQGWIKVNIDASLNSQRSSLGFGCVVRDANGRFMAAKAGCFCSQMEVKCAEAMTF
ncbi:uncharacterized protein LOC110606249 [Manihot esculenta]|uniref:uncharacterized protein LOC110606249 n=1 Tax=Manihot esculenta TaxID=3983 RepID=UPI001CC55439|nr:uncharacterized protein LOC110606249 [Manihot esculenta]